MSTEIVKAAPAGLDMVSTFADVERMASALMKAGGGFIPAHFKNPAQVAAVILAGRELGVPPMASLRSFFLIDGKLGMEAAFCLGRMLAHGITAEWTRDDDTGATVVLTRAGTKPYASTFAKADAERAGLWGRGPWARYPRAMLKARAATAGARAYAPDVFAGSVYTAEELRGGEDEAPAPIAVQVVSEPVPDVYQQILGYLDAATSLDEIAEIRASVVKPAWSQLDKAQRLEVEAAAKNAKTRAQSGGVRDGDIVDATAEEIIAL